MSTIIVYATKYGATEKCAKILAQKIGGEVQLVKLGTDEVPCLHCADNILIGGSVYAGRILGAVKRFTSANLEVLLQKKLGLFLCAAEQNEPHRTEQINAAFDKSLRDHAISIETVGHEINYEKLSFIHKMITKLVSKQTESHSALDTDAMDRMADVFRGQ